MSLNCLSKNMFISIAGSHIQVYKMVNTKKRLLIAREILELGVKKSMVDKNVAAFDSHMAQLKMFYSNYEREIGESASKYELLGFNLLSLLSQNRFYDFSNALESLPHGIPKTDPFIRYVGNIYKYFMRTNYKKILQAQKKSPSPMFEYFVDILVKKSRLQKLNLAMTLHKLLKMDWDKPKPSVKKCGKFLNQLETELVNLGVLSTCRSMSSENELLIAQDFLEIAVEHSVVRKDLMAFEQYMCQLRHFYLTYENEIGQSPNKYKLLGLSLLFLLSQNRLPEFLHVLDSLPHEIIEKDSFIRHPLIIKRYLVDKNYSKVIQAKAESPSKIYEVFMDILLEKAHQEIIKLVTEQHHELKVEWDKPAPDLGKCDTFLNLLKAELTTLGVFSTDKILLSEKEILLARNFLEIAIEHSLARQNLVAFELYLAQLKRFYLNYENKIGESARKYQLLGLNLLFLLGQSRLSEFLAEKDLLPQEAIAHNEYILYALKMAQYIIEGNNKNIVQAKNQVPLRAYSMFMDNILETVRKQHLYGTSSCPNYVKKCPECLVFSLNGDGHSREICKGTVSSFGEAYAQKSIPLFEIRLENPGDQLNVLNKATGRFEIAQNIIYAHAVNGIFTIGQNEKRTITFRAAEINRFSIAIAYFVGGAFRLRFRIVITLTDGVLFFKMFKTFENQNQIYQIPPEFDTNTVAIFGIGPSLDESEMTFKIFANTCSENTNFYKCQVKYNKFRDDITFIGNDLKGKGHGNNLRFHKDLYSPMELSSNPMCPNCSIDLKWLNFRRDVAVNTMSMPMFQISVKNYNGLLQIFNKKTNKFETCIEPLHAHNVDGVFVLSEKSIIFHALELKRFKVAVAFFSRNKGFVTKFGIETHRDGIVCRPMEQILNNVENEYNIREISPDLVLIVGIVSQDILCNIDIDVFGNMTWKENHGHVSWFSRTFNGISCENLKISETLNFDKDNDDSANKNDH